MERTIDRTSYRRSLRNGNNINKKIIEKEEIEQSKSNKTFKIKNMILNQIIVSLLIIIMVLIAEYYDMTDVTQWISKNMSGGYEITEIFSILKMKINKYVSFGNYFSASNFQDSGEKISGELLLIDISGEHTAEVHSGEINISGDLLNAVEGINQMADDAKKIKEIYQFITPLKGTITSYFGSRESDNPLVSSYHTGIDIGAELGTEIQCAHDGKVILAKNYSSYGNCVMVENENLLTVYAHCSSLHVSEGQYVKQGDVIAKVGMTGNATGPHLHFEIRYEGRYIDPLYIVKI